MTVTTKTNNDDPLKELQTLVARSKKRPDRFDWKANLNPWQILFVDYILSLARNIPDLQLTNKQSDKVKECIARMTLI